MPSFGGPVEKPEGGKVGIACSGGGIRSAAFNLGALQALEKKEVLQKSSYLSGVSGGSYIAAALCILRRSWAGGGDSEGSLLRQVPPFAPGSPEEQYLRNRSSYLAPTLLDKLSFGWRVLLGLALNLAVVGLFVFVLAIPLAALYGAIHPSLDQTIHACQGHPGGCGFSAWPPKTWIWVSIATAFAASLVLGAMPLLFFAWNSRRGDFASTWSVRALLLTAALAALLVGVPLLLVLVRTLGEHQTTLGAASKSKFGAPAVGAGAATSVAAGALLTLRADWLEVRAAAKRAVGVAHWWTGLGRRVRRGIALMLAVLVVPALALALALFAMSWVLNLGHPWELWRAEAVCLAALAVLYCFTDLTSWSLHPLYRRRLASAFALRRVGAAGEAPPPIGEPDVGVAEERDYDTPFELTSLAPPLGIRWPTLLICAAANVSDDAATPPGRAVTSFTFSAWEVGGPLVGAVTTERYLGALDPDGRLRVTVPAAVAMSGAALSPSMGKMTRRPLRMLIAIANLRLGVWVPNPRRLEETNRRDGLDVGDITLVAAARAVTRAGDRVEGSACRYSGARLALLIPTAGPTVDAALTLLHDELDSLPGDSRCVATAWRSGDQGRDVSGRARELLRVGVGVPRVV